MSSKKFKTKQEIAKELELSLSTLQRRLSSSGLLIPRGLISPSVQTEIYETLGFQVKS
jgi:hypothetical protein